MRNVNKKSWKRYSTVCDSENEVRQRIRELRLVFPGFNWDYHVRTDGRIDIRYR